MPHLQVAPVHRPARAQMPEESSVGDEGHRHLSREAANLQKLYWAGELWELRWPKGREASTALATTANQNHTRFVSVTQAWFLIS